MSLPCDDLHRFADGELDRAEHQRFAIHLASCEACGRGLETILVLGAMADGVVAEARAAAPVQAAEVPARPARPWKPSLLKSRRVLVFVALGGAFAAVLLWYRTRGLPADRALLAELQARPYRSLEARLAVAELSRYRPLSRERGPEEKAVDALTTYRQQGLAALEARGAHQQLGAVYLLGKQFTRAQRALAAAGETPDVRNDRAVLALERGQPAEALALLEGVLAERPTHGPALWNKALALEHLGRREQAIAVLKACAAAGEPGWSQEAVAKARALQQGEGSRGPP
jgi:tetratricopeptide (TPR) repeat protein